MPRMGKHGLHCRSSSLIMSDKPSGAYGRRLRHRGGAPSAAPNRHELPRSRCHCAALARLLEDQYRANEMDDAAIARADSLIIKDAVSQSRRAALWIGSGDEPDIPSDSRHTLAAASHALALEHHRTIIEAIATFCIGSACALMRCQLDAYVQGLYLSECLTDDKVRKFIEDRSGPSSGTMRRAVTSIPRIKNGALAKIIRDHGSALNSYTHGGMHQLSRRLREGSIEPTYGEQEVLTVLAFANSIAFSSLGEIFDLAGRHDLRRQADQRFVDDVQEWRARGLPI